MFAWSRYLLLIVVFAAAGALLWAPVSAAAVHGSAEAVSVEIAYEHAHGQADELAGGKHDATDHLHDVPHPVMPPVLLVPRWAAVWTDRSKAALPPGHRLLHERPPQHSR